MIGEVHCIIPKGNVCSALNITANSAEKKELEKKPQKPKLNKKQASYRSSCDGLCSQVFLLQGRDRFNNCFLRLMYSLIFFLNCHMQGWQCKCVFLLNHRSSFRKHHYTVKSGRKLTLLVNLQLRAA